MRSPRKISREKYFSSRLLPPPPPRGNAHGRLKEELEVTGRSFHALFAGARERVRERERDRGKRVVRLGGRE